MLPTWDVHFEDMNNIELPFVPIVWCTSGVKAITEETTRNNIIKKFEIEWHLKNSTSEETDNAVCQDNTHTMSWVCTGKNASSKHVK